MVDINEWRLSKAKDMCAIPYNAKERNLLGIPTKKLYGKYTYLISVVLLL